MKSFIELFNNKYDKKLCEHKSYKMKFETMKKHLKECGIVCDANNDIDCIRYEIIESSLQVKQQFEDVFFDTYVHMFDYWYDLTYQERKQQMNVDIKRLTSSKTSFMFENERIYMPCFDPAFNHLYHTEIVLLDLKQYHAFIRSFASEVKECLYGILPYRYGFTSTQIVAEMGERAILFQNDIHRFYLYEDNKLQILFSLDPKQNDLPMNEVKQLAMLLLLDRLNDIAELLLEGSLISDKMKKKVKKNLAKHVKKGKS